VTDYKGKGRPAMTTEVDYGAPLSPTEVEEYLADHQKMLIGLRQDLDTLISVVDACMKEYTKQFDFLLVEILQHRVTEFKKPSYSMNEAIARLEEIQGKLEYTHKALKEHLERSSTLKRGKYDQV